MNQKRLALYLDFANHRPEATEEDIKKLCMKIKEFGFHSAFVNPIYISFAKEQLGEKGVVGTVISFPIGQEITKVKIYSSSLAIKLGASEIDVSMNVGFFKDKKYSMVLDEMRAIVEKVKEIKKSTVVKFIIETGFLTDKEIKKASELVFLSGADFVKTCSGWGPRNTTIKDIELIRSVVSNRIKIKVAGGITNHQQALNFINAGVDRIGTSHAVEIIKGIERTSQKFEE